jgi:SAM-dependent methyltransferase
MDTIRNAKMNQNFKTDLIIRGVAVAAISTSYEKQALDDYADRYDAWYNSPKGRALLATEVACLRPLVELFPRPYLEVGVGTGRLAEALGIEWGIDPSTRALEKARRRGVNAVLGTGEHLPLEDARFGGVLVAFTLCFVRNPYKVMAEVRRVLVPNGGLVLGLLLKGTPWADFYARRGAEGHPLYSTAHFYSRERVETLLKQNGFRTTAYRSTLFQEPGLEVYEEEQPVDGYVPGAGFVGITAVKI